MTFARSGKNGVEGDGGERDKGKDVLGLCKLTRMHVPGAAECCRKTRPEEGNRIGGEAPVAGVTGDGGV